MFVNISLLVFNSSFFVSFFFFNLISLKVLQLLSNSWNCLIALCMALQDSLTFFSMFSASIVDIGSLFHISCHLIQSEHVIHRFLYGSKSFTSLASFSYLKKQPIKKPLKIDYWKIFSFNYASYWHAKETLAVVVRVSKILALFKRFVKTATLIRHFMGLLQMAMCGQASHIHLLRSRYFTLNCSVK